MSKLEKALITLAAMNDSSTPALSAGVDARAVLIVTLTYLVVLLSVPLPDLGMLLWFAIYPIIASAWLGNGYMAVLRKSLVVLPLILFIGIFNPMLDHTPAFRIGKTVVSEGWVTFVSIMVRGMLAVQAVLIMIGATGMTGMCRAMSRLGVPKFITTQLMFVYRYMTVLLSEALTMRRAREARGYGRKGMSISMWGTFIGQLFIRTVDRSEKISNAMLARGFCGEIPNFRAAKSKWSVQDTVFVTVSALLFIILRLYHLSNLFM